MIQEGELAEKRVAQQHVDPGKPANFRRIDARTKNNWPPVVTLEGEEEGQRASKDGKKQERPREDRERDLSTTA